MLNRACVYLSVPIRVLLSPISAANARKVFVCEERVERQSCHAIGQADLKLNHVIIRILLPQPPKAGITSVLSSTPGPGQHPVRWLLGNHTAYPSRIWGDLGGGLGGAEYAIRQHWLVHQVCGPTGSRACLSLASLQLNRVQLEYWGSLVTNARDWQSDTSGLPGPGGLAWTQRIPRM